MEAGMGKDVSQQNRKGAGGAFLIHGIGLCQVKDGSIPARA
jgi:hypothetical protein